MGPCAGRQVAEVERVLSTLRNDCGVTDSIKFKADGVTLLNLYKDNEYGIPPSFYAAGRGVRAPRPARAERRKK